MENTPNISIVCVWIWTVCLKVNLHLAPSLKPFTQKTALPVVFITFTQNHRFKCVEMHTHGINMLTDWTCNTSLCKI